MRLCGGEGGSEVSTLKVLCTDCVMDTVLWDRLYHLPPAALDAQLTSFSKCIT